MGYTPLEAFALYAFLFDVYVKEVDEYLAKLKNANVSNAKFYKTAKAEHTRFTTVHKTLFTVNLEHKPKAPQKQRSNLHSMELR